MKMPPEVLKAIIENAKTLEERFSQASSRDIFIQQLTPVQLYHWEQNLSRVQSVSIHVRLDSFSLLGLHGQSDSNFIPDWARFVSTAISDALPIEGFQITLDQLPFASSLRGFVHTAVRQLQELPEWESLLLPEVRSSLSHMLLGELHELSSLAFYADFLKKVGMSYPTYLDFLEKGGLITFFETYPSLCRLLGQRSLDWIFGIKVLLQRLAHDYRALQSFLSEGDPLGKVQDISQPQSVAHNAFGPVRIITFENGQTIYYKTKSAATDDIYNAVCGWANAHFGTEELKPLRYLKRDGYSWHCPVEYPVSIEGTDAADYYRRAGYLVAITQVLGSTDYHLDNVIASGAYPVLIDNETMLSNEIKLPFASNSTDRFDPFRSMLLEDVNEDQNPAAEDMSGFFGESYSLTHSLVDFDQDGNPVLREVSVIRRGSNRPVVLSDNLSNEHLLAHSTAGYASMLRLITDHRDKFYEVVRKASDDFSVPIRCVLRDTKWYWSVRETLRQPENLQQGLDRSIALDKLCAVYAGHLSDTDSVRLLQKETDALHSMYIPALFISDKSLIHRTAQQIVEGHLALLGEKGVVEEQVERMQQLLLKGGYQSTSNPSST